ncbi:HdeD family acid-resistance protein [Hymenobacter bucti]|uniref:HdeD family acid-resistance protein n=1 Tax=Hymenobacter bucti TaxID=1844114 RepID=A0ABW4QUY7_9BACT
METSSPLRPVAANWWVFVLAGLGLFGLGLWVFNSPDAAFLGMTFYFAALILFNGVANAVFALTNRSHLRGWGWLLALGIGEIVFGFYMLTQPIVAAGTLAFFIGFWLLLRGGSTVANAFALRRLGYRRWGWSLALGLLGIVLAFLVIGNPVIGVIGVTTWLAFALLIMGVAAFVLGLRLRRAA